MLFWLNLLQAQDLSPQLPAEVGRELAQVDEPLSCPPNVVIFELEAYPQPKALSPTQLNALYTQLGSNDLVAKHIGASKNFVRATRTSKIKPKGKV